MARKIKLMTDAELKQVKEEDSYSITTNGPCFVSDICDDLNTIACSGVAGEKCTATWNKNPNVTDGYSLSSVTCGNMAYLCASGSFSGTGSGSGLPTDDVSACAGKPNGAQCSWFNGSSVKTGKCQQVGGRKYCIDGAKKS